MPNRRNFGRQMPVRPRPLPHNRSLSAAQNDFTGTSYNAGQVQSSQNENKNHETNLYLSQLKIPEIPAMNGLAFETFFLVYLLAALLAQYLFIFKTVWWYPSTLPPSTMTVNFHLIDQNLTAFLILLFSRRFLWLVMWRHLKPASNNSAFLLLWISACVVVFGVWIFEMAKNLIALHDHVRMYKLMFLCYPLLLWIPLNGCSDESCLKCVMSFISKKCSKNRQMTQRLLDQSDLLEDGKIGVESIDAEQMRDEVQQLCRDFNSRLAEIVFGSMVCSYYAGLVPMFFTKSHHSYDISWSLQHTALILVNTFAMLSSYLLPPHYLQTLHKSAVILGGFQLVDKESEQNICEQEDVQDWTQYRGYSYGTFVKYKSNVFMAVGKCNTAIPTNTTHSRFLFMFYKPLRMMNWLLGLHFAVVVFQIHVLIWSSHWDRLIAPAVLQFFSYYILFTTLRDRIMLGKFYNLHRHISLRQ